MFCYSGERTSVPLFENPGAYKTLLPTLSFFLTSGDCPVPSSACNSLYCYRPCTLPSHYAFNFPSEYVPTVSFAVAIPVLSRLLTQVFPLTTLIGRHDLRQRH